MKMWNFDWPKAYPDTGAFGVLKSKPEDFKVDEIPQVSPCGEGEHIYLHIKKTEVNTHWVAKLLAEKFGVKEHDVSYAGQKDRYAITTQWFSIYAPKVEMLLDSRPFADEDIEVLQQTRHSKKLRRGDLVGNRFDITLKDIHSKTEYSSTKLKQLIEDNLQKIKMMGVPNYFGSQRFGRGGGNMDQALSMLTGKRREKNRQKKSMYLSAARSYIFNEVIAARIQQGLWGNVLTGDVDIQGIETDQISLTTAPLWGRGRLTSLDDALSLEQTVSGPHYELCDGMEHAGLNQERRAIVSIIENMQWQWVSDTELNICFALSSGHYATSVLQEFMQAEEPERFDNTPFVYKGSLGTEASAKEHELKGGN